VKHPIGHTHNGTPVYIDLIGSPAAKYIAQQPHLLGLAKEMLGKAEIRNSRMIIEKNMGRAIGYSRVVNTTDNDIILYGCLRKETIYTRFVKNGDPTPTPYLTATLRLDSEDNYELYDIWIGRRKPPRPGSTDETAESKPYWATHAVVFDSQPLQSQTITKVCPY
jgi:hypothetical protein